MRNRPIIGRKQPKMAIFALSIPTYHTWPGHNWNPLKKVLEAIGFLYLIALDMRIHDLKDFGSTKNLTRVIDLRVVKFLTARRSITFARHIGFQNYFFYLTDFGHSYQDNKLFVYCIIYKFKSIMVMSLHLISPLDPFSGPKLQFTLQQSMITSAAKSRMLINNKWTY